MNVQSLLGLPSEEIEPRDSSNLEERKEEQMMIEEKFA